MKTFFGLGRCFLVALLVWIVANIIIRTIHPTPQEPEFVANISPTKQLFRITKFGNKSYYVVDSQATNQNPAVTVNRPVTTGKTSHTETSVFIDGVEYTPK